MPRKLKHEHLLFLLALGAGAPGLAALVVLVWMGEHSAAIRWSAPVLVMAISWVFAYAVLQRARFPLRTLSNLLSGIREGDYSIRARVHRHDDALGEAFAEANALSRSLREHRLGALETAALLRTVMTEIDVAVFTFDGQHRLQWLNRAGERLLARPAEQLLDRMAPELGLADLLEGDPSRTLQLSFAGGSGRWGVRRSSFRQDGRPHQLLVLTDLSRALRDEEREAWQRIVRVIGHELNNSLAPIKSIAATMGNVLTRSPRPEDWEADLQNGLGIIASRADSLARFMEGYSRLARLPAPRRAPLDIGSCIRRVCSLETRLNVEMVPGPEITISADRDQLEQLFINLIRNAVDALLEQSTGGRVRVGWRLTGGMMEVWVEDEGPGIANPGNLFVPFFTTKPHGTGIGLVFSRQIAEAHGGTLTLEGRRDRSGCLAKVRLPIGR